ncbi:MAG: biopolymer transporter ExbD [Sulfurovaceae bacterium]|nr:biopolymer transporter ExbD [Sulfurovaceae bacterium]
MQIKKFDSINVVPFIDIMLVLLVIVLTTASFIQMGVIKVDLPSSSAAIEEKPKKEIKVSIDKDGRIYIDKIEIKREEFEAKILTNSKDTPIYLFCDKNAKFDNFVFLLDILKNNGYEKLGIVTTNE